MADDPAHDPERQVPVHLGVIMDGNGRWARQRGLPRTHGHRVGVETVRTIVRAARERGIRFITLYSFSTENWARPKDEISELFKLLRFFIRRDLAELHQNNVRIRVIGEREGLPADIAALLGEAENLTRNNTAQDVILAFNYGSRQEIAAAARRIAAKVAAGTLDPVAVDETLVAEHLYTNEIPDPDIILRTAGEKRLSNFLMWQAAYSEFVFIEKPWPEVTDADLDAVLEEYARRNRKFGGLADDSGKDKALQN